MRGPATAVPAAATDAHKRWRLRWRPSPTSRTPKSRYGGRAGRRGDRELTALARPRAAGGVVGGGAVRQFPLKTVIDKVVPHSKFLRTDEDTNAAFGLGLNIGSIQLSHEHRLALFQKIAPKAGEK